MISKALQLLSWLSKSPREFWDRTTAIICGQWELSPGVRPAYATLEMGEAMRRLPEALGSNTMENLGEAGLAQIETQVRQRQTNLPPDAPFGRFHDSDTLVGRLCYLVARTLRPRAVLETGVCYGVTSAHLLAALEVNGEGHLYSIDLPPLGKNADEYVGWLVPNDLRHRWTLQRGTSARLLGPVLANLGEVDLFLHDSLHTYRNMRNEFSSVWPALRPGGVVISDDIESNRAFLELSKLPDVAISVVIREQNKDSLLGVAVKKQ